MHDASVQCFDFYRDSIIANNEERKTRARVRFHFLAARRACWSFLVNAAMLYIVLRLVRELASGFYVTAGKGLESAARRKGSTV